MKHVLIFTGKGLFNPVKVHSELVTVAHLAVHFRVLVSNNNVLSAIWLKYIGNLGSDVTDSDARPAVADLVTGAGNARKLAVQFIVLVLEHMSKDSVSKFSGPWVGAIFSNNVNRGFTDLFSPFSIRSQFISDEGVNVFRFGRRGTNGAGNKLVPQFNLVRTHSFALKSTAVLGKHRNDIFRGNRSVNQVLAFSNVKRHVMSRISTGTTFTLGIQRSIALNPICRILQYVSKCNLVRQRLHGTFNGFSCCKNIIGIMFRHVTSNEYGNFLVRNLVDAFIVVDVLALIGKIPLQP